MKKIMINKKILLFIGILITSVFILSGCNLIKKSSTTNDGGIYKTTDFGENWEQKVFVANLEDGTKTIGNVDTKFIVFDPVDENTIYLVTQGNGIYKTTDSAEQWVQTSLSSGTYRSLTIDTRNNNVIYVTDGKYIFKTIDNMKTWNKIYIESRPNQSIVSVIADHFKPNIIYAATTTGLIKSYDYGNTWQLLNWDNTKISKLYQSYISPNTFYMLTAKGIYKSINAGESWEKISEQLSEFAKGDQISWMFFDPRNEYIILGTGYGIIRSIDQGNSWQSIPTLFEFDRITIKPVVYNPNDTNDYIFAVKNVLNKSDDAGKTWKTIKSIPTSRIVNYIIADPYHDDVIYAGTYLPKE